ncbi:Gfo/Idh/MocA family oxidoreductase [Streptomyces canus]|uniref:Dehydrogenase n=1 Tax=Streptomyces canus TaxID=58343 RepID=A0AAW8FAE7_9ACTN|nr:Gfo/Idh/MocA family oxidoreductase [Streptomyces canus]MDQ0765892.1 putative dehydrogenase [Streptomyces canus]MDQ0906070.1 putative dehydrogenase [Streptomyces canus]MDQ1066016.1 putative dehydrogenase [Streptomyces canus]
MTVRVGVIGAGVMGADHVRLLHGFVPSAEAVAVADVDGTRARAVASGVPGRSSAPTRGR